MFSVGLVTSYNRLLLVAAALVLAAAGLIVWYGWLPHYRPAIEANESYGIDVSHHQGDIDWARVADDDITFAYIKATEGGDFVDAQFADNWEQAGANGVDRGAYHFFTLCRPGLEQAENFLRVVPWTSRRCRRRSISSSPATVPSVPSERGSSSNSRHSSSESSR